MRWRSRVQVLAVNRPHPTRLPVPRFPSEPVCPRPLRSLRHRDLAQVIETTDIEMADASERIKEHRDRKEKLEVAAGEARALLSERRQFLDSADTIATFAAEIKPKGHALLAGC